MGAHIPLPLYYQLDSLLRLLPSDSRIYHTLSIHLKITRDIRMQEQYQTMISDAVKSVESFINPEAYENTYTNDTTPSANASSSSNGAPHHYINPQTIMNLMNTPIHH